MTFGIILTLLNKFCYLHFQESHFHLYEQVPRSIVMIGNWSRITINEILNVKQTFQNLRFPPSVNPE